MAPMWLGVGVWLALAAGSGIADWRRVRRDRLDAVGWVPWTFIQIMAILGAVITAALALGGR